MSSILPKLGLEFNPFEPAGAGARYDGNAVLVDEFTAELGKQAGLFCREIRAVRWRGNSAQQMGRHGRVASRESIVVFEKR